jgi:NTP pyrophosphatase (non-canonical NTP hydrolase)
VSRAAAAAIARKLGDRVPLARRIEAYDRPVELSEYQRRSRRTAEYPREAWLAYPALGLAGEAGEVAEHAKKAIRDDAGEVSAERRAAMAKELGDVLWYVSQLASELGLDLDEIAQVNLDKLRSRQRRGVLSGSGDER